jgi:hypothetical protein
VSKIVCFFLNFLPCLPSPTDPTDEGYPTVSPSLTLRPLTNVKMFSLRILHQNCQHPSPCTDTTEKVGTTQYFIPVLHTHAGGTATFIREYAACISYTVKHRSTQSHIIFSAEIRLPTRHVNRGTRQIITLHAYQRASTSYLYKSKESVAICPQKHYDLNVTIATTYLNRTYYTYSS